MPDENLPPRMLAINPILHPHVIMSVSVSYGAINNGEIRAVVFTLLAHSLSVTPYFPLLSITEVSPRRRMLNVSRSVWKQANVASDLWEKLTARCVDRHRHMDRTLERLLQIQAAMEELAVALEQAEGVRDAWEPVGDLFIDSLQDHIDATKVIHLRWLDHKWLMQTNRCLHFSDWILKGMVSDLATTYISYYFSVLLHAQSITEQKKIWVSLHLWRFE